MKHSTALLLALFLATSQALADNQSDFKQAYQNYNQALKSQDMKQAYKAAKKAFSLGKKVYGSSSETAANLAMNLAAAAKEAGKRDEALEAYDDAYSILETIHGKNSLQLANPLLGQARIFIPKKKGPDEKYIDALEDLADANRNKHPAIAAKVYFEAAISSIHKSRLRKNRDLLLKADDIYTRIDKESSYRRNETKFWLAKSDIAFGNEEDAIEKLTQVVNAFDEANGNAHQLAIESRKFLVQAFEKAGERDKATEHCVAIGQYRRWGQDSYDPLYRQKVKVPKDIAKNHNSLRTLVSMTIDEEGYPIELSIAESSGNGRYDKLALDAVAQSRFAPKFEGGKPVKFDMDYRVGWNKVGSTTWIHKG